MDESDTGPAADRRWALRRKLELPADLKDADGHTHAATIVDISEEGCRIETASGREIDRHRLHTVKITGLEAIPAYVSWSRESSAGLTFAEPLHPAVVQNLVVKSLYARLSRFEENRKARGREGLSGLPPFPFGD
ncbi:PilZ domain-containing protein [Erythrobacter sp. NE805]|uniref:PilZ domain-containing protein n=1 Tax=Erythrobacter sp. NE805 TaxID=3389875 RepID=UPI00396B1074